MIRGLTVNANTGEIEIARGDDQTIRFTVTDSAGVALNVAAGTFKFTVKDSVDDDIADALFQKQDPAGNGIDLTSAASGIVDVNIDAADTVNYAGNKVWDLQMTLAGKVRTLNGGVFRIRKEVSTPGTSGQPSTSIVPFPGSIAIDGVLYMLDATTGLYGAFRLNDSNWEQSATQSASIPFTF